MAGRRQGAIGVAYSPWLQGAGDVAAALAERVRAEGEARVFSVLDLEGGAVELEGLSLLVGVGGDGTILRAVRAAAPAQVPLVGVNMGRVGYLTEFTADEAEERIGAYARGKGWMEERTMLQARVVGRGGGLGPPSHALNDAVVGGTVARLFFVDAVVDGHLMASYAADGVIVATATGSTGHALSAGGPIVYPESASLLVKPIAPQLATDAAVVLRPGAVVELLVQSNHRVTLTLDGYVELPVSAGDTVRVEQSPHKARFLRAGSPHQLPSVLTQRLSSARREERYAWPPRGQGPAGVGGATAPRGGGRGPEGEGRG